MKKLFLILSLAILGCSYPARWAADNPITPLPSPALTQTPVIPPELGAEQNPLILALSPSARPNADMIAAGEVIAAFIESRTGYTLVTVAPTSETALVDALEKGNAHIAALSPFGYLFGREQEALTVILASMREGQIFYGAQFIANRENGFTAYYDAERGENTAEASVALKQFEDKKPCWSDAASPSAYVIPFGLLTQSQVQVRSAAFLEGQLNVVRAVYARDICDFGATFIDARELPSLEADYADVLDRVVVIWRTPSVIPYENISLSTALPLEMRRVLQRAFVDLMLTPEGKAAVQTVYGMDELQVVEDAMYDGFASYTKAAGLNLLDLIK